MKKQVMMKKDQQLQKNMMSEKNIIDEMRFVGKSSFVTVTLKGTKEVEKVEILEKNLEPDEIEMLQDMILVAMNDALKQIDVETEKRLGKYTQGMPGLF